MTKYSEAAQQTIDKTMHKFKQGKLKSGSSGETVKNRKQAVAIGISEARKKHQKVPSEHRDS